MTTGSTQIERSGCRGRWALGLGLALALAPAAADAKARVCTQTAAAQFDACKSEVKDDFFAARALCLNESDAALRDACFDEAKSEQQDAADECREQRTARRELCAELGEEAYDPDFDPADFDVDFSTPGNPYYPLAIGNHWVYEGGDETVTIEVLPETKLIEGVTCVVARDIAEVGGQIVEDTDDWLGERLDGTIDYCGEISQNFELFPGDDPAEPELVDVDGSWKAGRDAKGGTLFLASPEVGRVYRQEFAPGDAEDAARVLSTTYAFGSNAELDQFVPQALVELLCAAGDCVVTAEFTPIDPEAFERKYYAPGIGLFLEVGVASGEIVQLVECNVDPACQSLPTP